MTPKHFGKQLQIHLIAIFVLMECYENTFDKKSICFQVNFNFS